MPNIQIDPGYILTAFVGLIVWFTRLESKTNRNELDIKENKIEVAVLREKHEDLETNLIRELGEVKQALARIEGQLSK